METGFKVKIRRKDGRPLYGREWVKYRDLGDDNTGYCISEEKRATIFYDEAELESPEFISFIEWNGYVYELFFVK